MDGPDGHGDRRAEAQREAQGVGLPASGHRVLPPRPERRGLGVRREGDGLMRWLLILIAALLLISYGTSMAMSVTSDVAWSSSPEPKKVPATLPCPEEDDPSWNWVRCGNGQRGIVTMWGTPKVVSCGDMRWLVRHRDLDERLTPWIVGDYSCGRRR